MVTHIKVEDINYTFPTKQIAVEDFDIEMWLKQNPINYFKLIHLLFTTTNNAPVNIPRTPAILLTEYPA